MFRVGLISQSFKVINAQVLLNNKTYIPRTTVGRASHGEPDIFAEKFDEGYVKFFESDKIDGWQIRKGMNDVLGMDMVPDPKIIIAGLHACRRVNDYALAVRWLEGCKDKCGIFKSKIYPWMLQEIRPTLDELGILTVEEMGYRWPELYLKSINDRLKAKPVNDPKCKC